MKRKLKTLKKTPPSGRLPRKFDTENTDRKLALQPKKENNKKKKTKKEDQRILPSVAQCQTSSPNLKQIFAKEWHFIKGQKLPSDVFKEGKNKNVGAA